MSTQPYSPQATHQSPYYPSHTQYSHPTMYTLPPPSPIKANSPTPAALPRPPIFFSVNPRVASRAIQNLIVADLKEAGFDSAQKSAVDRIETEVVAFVQGLFLRAHEYANLANRASPIVKDLLLTCQQDKLETKALRRVALRSSKKRKRERTGAIAAPILVTSPRKPPSPKLLPSDDEDAPPFVPITLRTLPPQFPGLPAKHTYLRTPACPPKKQALPSLEKKLKTAALVQESLRNLLLATEENENQEDGELLGHIVNWEATTYPRKRWKI